jgi:hypothetical protein
VESLQATVGEDAAIIVGLRDRQYIFDKPVLTERYAGDNVPPDGVEGTADDIKGQVKPRTYGKVFNVTPPMVNASKQTFEVNDDRLANISAVYHGGLTVTQGSDYPSVTTLHAASVSAATYATSFIEGYFRLGSAVEAEVTADVIQGAAADRTVAQILKALALEAGVSEDDISDDDVTALDADATAEVGVWIDDDSTFSDIMDQVAVSQGAYYGFDPTGVLRMGRLTEPDETAVVTLHAYDIDLDELRRRPITDNGAPAWRVTVRWGRNYTVQESGLYGSVTPARRAYLREEFRSAVSENTATLDQYRMAGEITVDTLLTTEADAQAEADRLLALYGVRRDVWDVRVPISVVSDNGLRLMDTVGLQLDRYGLDDGRNFRLIAIGYDLELSQAILQIWG